MTSINSISGSDAWPKLTKSHAEIFAKNVTKIQIEKNFARNFQSGYGNGNLSVNIPFPMIGESVSSESNFLDYAKRSTKRLLYYTKSDELLPVKNFLESLLKNSNGSVLKANRHFPEDIDSRISKFGQRVVESLKNHFEADEFLKDKKISCDVTWVQESDSKYIQIEMWD